MVTNETQESVNSLKRLYEHAIDEVRADEEENGDSPTILEVSAIHSDTHQVASVKNSILRADQVYYMDKDGTSLRAMPIEQANGSSGPTELSIALSPYTTSSPSTSAAAWSPSTTAELNRPHSTHTKAHRKNRRVQRSLLPTITSTIGSSSSLSSAATVASSVAPMFFEVVREVDYDETNQVLDIVDYNGEMVGTAAASSVLQPGFSLSSSATSTLSPDCDLYEPHSTSMPVTLNAAASRKRRRIAATVAADQLYAGDDHHDDFRNNLRVDAGHDDAISSDSCVLRTTFGSSNFPVLNSQPRGSFKQPLFLI